MSPVDKKRILVDYLRMKTEDGDWHAVSDAANDLREVEIHLQHSLPPKSLETQPEPKESKIGPTEDGLETPAPSEIEIKHHVDRVQSLLRMSDSELVDALFPEENLSAED
jgi:hypothetical protein